MKGKLTESYCRRLNDKSRSVYNLHFLLIVACLYSWERLPESSFRKIFKTSARVGPSCYFVLTDPLSWLDRYRDRGSQARFLLQTGDRSLAP